MAVFCTTFKMYRCYCCSGSTPETKGTAYVVYEDIFDAKNACDHLSGFNVCNRYLVVLYYQPNKVSLLVLCRPMSLVYLIYTLPVLT